MGAVYIMAHQDNGRVHFHVVFCFYGTPAETPEALAAILRLEVWKRWKKLNPGLNHTGNRLKIRAKPSGLWYLARHLTVGKTAKEKGKPSWYGLRNKRLIEAHALPVTLKQVQREFDIHFPAITPAIVPAAKQTNGKFYDKRELARLKAYLAELDTQDWESFKRAKTGRKGKIGDADFINFLNAQNGRKAVTLDNGETL
jgi:hypothetical protein